MSLVSLCESEGKQSLYAKRSVALAKTQVLGEFSEAMEHDFQSALKRFWQTIRGETVLNPFGLQWGWSVTELGI